MSAAPCEHAGVLLAAGRGRRMGELTKGGLSTSGLTKQLLPVRTLDGRRVPMVAAAFDALAAVCGESIVVVTGHEAGAVAGALNPRAFTEATSDPDADMMHSVRVGLYAARERFPRAAGYWLHLADHPYTAPATVELLREAYEKHAARRAVMPSYDGKGGHPVVMPGNVADAILAWRAGPGNGKNTTGGVRAFWAEHPGLSVRLPVSDAGVVKDVDTPQQYEG